MTKILRIVALALSLALVGSNSYAAVKAGSACSKAGSKSVSGGKSYTCIKSGKKLVWDKGVLVPVAKSAPSASPITKSSKHLKVFLSHYRLLLSILLWQRFYPIF